MFKDFQIFRNINFVVYRYEAIVAIIILILTGSISVSSPDAEFSSIPFKNYPFSIALTFDDGPHPFYTDNILAILKQYMVPATFFVVGSQSEKYPFLLKKISLYGHEIAGHTYSHRNLTHLGNKEIAEELVKTYSIINMLTGQDNNLFRPPGGNYNQNTINIAKNLGFSIILWTVFPRDHEENIPENIVSRVLEQATDGGVILLHSGRMATIKALPIIIKELRSRGYNFLTVSEIYKSVSDKKTSYWIKANSPNRKS